PFVVVPGNDLDHVAEDDRVHRAHDRRVRVAFEIARDERLLGVIHDPLERSLRCALECGVDLLLGDLALEGRCEVDHRNGRGGHAEGHAREAALQLRDDEGDGSRGAGLRGNDVLRRGPRITWIVRDGVEQTLAQRLRMDRREESLLDPELVVQHLRYRSEAVRRAGRVRDYVVLLRVELLLVHPEDDRLVLVLGWRGDDHVLRPRVDVRLRLRRVGEEPGRLHDYVDLEIRPRQLRRIAFLEHFDLASVDDKRVRGRRDLALVLAVVRI